MKIVRSSFLQEDVELLMKDVGGLQNPLSSVEREEKIKNGAKAYEFISLEEIPSEEEINLYDRALEISCEYTAKVVKNVAEKIYLEKGKNLVLVSLARGGLPAGILIKRYLEKKYCIKIKHYSICMIGTKGLDVNALKYILKLNNSVDIQFIDGWTGKGAILRALEKSLIPFPKVSSKLAVLLNPARLKNCIYGSCEDKLIACCCLNSLTSGLISRSVYNEEVIGKEDYYGAVFFEEFKNADKTYDFINKVEEKFDFSELECDCEENGTTGLEEVNRIAKEFGIENIHFVKPGVCEGVRAIIRKKPDVLLLKKGMNDECAEFIKEMAHMRDIEVKEYDFEVYNLCCLFTDSNSDVL